MKFSVRGMTLISCVDASDGFDLLSYIFSYRGLISVSQIWNALWDYVRKIMTNTMRNSTFNITRSSTLWAPFYVYHPLLFYDYFLKNFIGSTRMIKYWGNRRISYCRAIVRFHVVR